MIRHHPPEDRLAAYAAGGSSEAEGLLIATHLALCPACRRQLADLEALGGLLLEELPVEDSARAGLDRALTQTLARLERPLPPAKPIGPKRIAAKPGSASPLLPRPLRDYAGEDPAKLSWRAAGPGLRIHALPVSGAKVWLMRVAPGQVIPEHGHTGQELVMVLAGGYRDGAEPYLPGDVQASGPETQHRPMADADGECLCLAVVDGRIRLSSPLGRVLATLLGF